MKFTPTLLSLSVVALLSGCANLNTDTLMQSGAQAYQAARCQMPMLKHSAYSPAKRWTKKRKSRRIAANTPSV